VSPSPSPHATWIKAPAPGAGLNIPVLGLDPEALHEFLHSDRSPPNCMQLPELDGLLAGVAIGPETIMPSEWLPLVWGGEGPVFDDGREAQAVLGGIMSRYNQILQDVRDGAFEPILWRSSGGALIATDWAEGFGLAVALRLKSWGPLLEAKRHAPLLFPILALGGGPNRLSELGLDAELVEEIAQAAPEVLPACVMGIEEFWRERRTRPSSGPTAERIVGALPPKPGRNHPCPCGSGKKFKKCCGP